MYGSKINVELLNYIAVLWCYKMEFFSFQALGVIFSAKDENTTSVDAAVSNGNEEDTNFIWLLHQLPTIPHFEAVRPAVIVALRSALLVETNHEAVAAYLRLLASCALDEPLQEQADLSLVIQKFDYSLLLFCL